MSRTLLLLSLLPFSAIAQPTNLPRQDFWVTDGIVYAVAETNGVLYVGGDFKSIAPNGGRGGVFNIFSADSAPLFPQANGAILAVTSDGGGGWFAGGKFTKIGGVARTNLAHILPDLRVDTNWSPNPFGFTRATQRSAIFALLLRGSTLYAGGVFTNIAGVARNNFAALDGTTGNVLPWSANVDGEIYCLNTRSNAVYLGGKFVSVQGLGRNGGASIDADSGNVLGWDPNIGRTIEPSLTGIALGDGVIYVGGYFATIGGVARHNLAAVDPDLGLASSWDCSVGDPTLGQGIQALAISCTTLYVGGIFTNVGAVARNNIAAVDLETGLATDWNPNADHDVFALLLSGSTLYAGGSFTSIGGAAHNSVAALTVEAGVATGWNPRCDRGITSMALAGNNIFLGGALAAGGLSRRNLAAFDTTTGAPLAWDPGTDGYVRSLAVTRTTVYAGGNFRYVNGQERHYLAAINATNGQTLNWRADLAGYEPQTLPFTLSVGNNALYVGGVFSQLGPTNRNMAGAVDLVTAAPTAWAPYFDNGVGSLVVDGTTVYAGGAFQNIFVGVNFYPRTRLAQLNANTGVPTTWSPLADGTVMVLALNASTVYAGGFFEQASALPRMHAAAFDRTSGNVTAWNPNLTGGLESNVYSLAVSPSAVYVGGGFAFANGLPRQGLAVVDPINGAPTGFDAQLGDFRAGVFSMVLRGSRLFAGGTILTVGDEVRPFLSEFVEAGFPRFTSQPNPQTVMPQQSIVLQAPATGQLPLAYQWQKNGTNISGATNLQFTIASAQATNSGLYRAIVTNALGRVMSLEAAVTVLAPLAIVTQPVSQTVAPGTTVTLSVTVSGNPPPAYQWRLNGVNIPGAVYSTLVITNVQRTNGGSYDVIAANNVEAVRSAVATLLISGGSLPFADNLAARGLLIGASGSGGGNNQSASKEGAEPNHAGKLGGKSLWAGWVAPATGIATFHTRGSAFDTLLAVYTGTNYSSLVPWASDDDRGGFGASEVSFNALAGTEYLIALDGFAAASGNLLLSWNLDTSTVPFPRIYSQPLSASVSTGAVATFAVQITSGTPALYQWFHECRALVGQTNATLTITDVGAGEVGSYYVIVVNSSSRTARSEDAFLEIGPDSKALSKDKLEDLFLDIAPGGFRLSPLVALANGSFLSVNLGAVGSQILDNVGATTQAGEPIPCGVIGGSSKWMGFRLTTNGVLGINTIGSSIDTVLAVYTGTNLLNLHYVICDNNSAPDGIRSVVRFNATKDTNYFVAIDGVSGAQGTNITLNWKFGLPPAPISLSSNQSIHLGASASLQIALNSLTPDAVCVWRQDNRVIDGADGPTLALNNVQLGQAGTYTVTVSNFAGAVTIPVAIIKVASPIQIAGAIVPVNNAKAFRITGPLSQGYAIEATTNWTSWLQLATSNSAPSAINFLDLSSTNLTRRFYRVVPYP